MTTNKVENNYVNKKRGGGVLIRSRSNESFRPDISLESTKSEINMRSLDLSTGPDISLVGELKNELEDLKVELQSTHNEVTNLVLENGNLKKELKKVLEQLNALKDICVSPVSSQKSHATAARIKGRKLQVQSTPKPNNDPILKHNKQIQTDFPTNKPTLQGNICSQQELTRLPTVKLPTETRTTNIDNNIYIFGGQQCSGLSVQLLKARHGKPQQYNITSFVKPGATTQEILSTCTSLKPTEKDKIILSVGEHDKNPTQAMIELGATIKQFTKSEVIVLNVLESDFLNEHKLNSSTDIICNNFHNCTHLNVKNRDYRTSLANVLSDIIDQLDYNRQYLGYNTRSNRCNKVHELQSLYVKNHDTRSAKSVINKGTIPFYFPKLSAVQKSNTSGGPLNEIKEKGTIPYYFKPKQQNVNFFRE